MTHFDTWLKAQQAKGAYLNDMPHDGWTDTIELCGACGLFDDLTTHDCELAHED